MSNRAKRCHHEERVRKKYLHVAKRWAGGKGEWTVKLNIVRPAKWKDGNMIDPGLRVYRLDPSGPLKRQKFIERTARRLAHHHNCPCGMCKGERYNRLHDQPEIEPPGEET